MSTRESSTRTAWVMACDLQPGDIVLDTAGWLTVTHSQRTGNGSWMLRFEYGVRYYAPAAPVAVKA